MFQQFLIDWKLYRKSFFGLLAAQVGVFLFGMAMTWVIMTVDDNPGSWFCLGTFLGMLALAVITLLFYGFSYGQEFRLALSMGRGRMAFLGAFVLRLLAQLVAGYALVLVFHQIELSLYPIWYQGFENDFFFAFLTDWHIVFAFPCLTVLSLFIGALYAYFSKKGLWFFYIMWMFCCIVLPRMFDVTAQDTGVLNRTAFWLLTAFLALPAGVWITAASLLLLTMATAVIRMAQKQMV